MGSSSHLKRLAMPRSWPLPRKTTVWVTRPSPGGHSLERCMPVNLIVRDVLGRAQSAREVRFIVHNELIKVDRAISILVEIFEVSPKLKRSSCHTIE